MTNEEISNLISRLKNPEKIVKTWTIRDICIDVLASMFTYKGLPESMPQEYAERFFVMNGSAAAWKLDDPLAVRYKGKLISSIGCPAERPDCYGIGEKYIANTFSGYVKTLTDDDGAIGWNNSMHTSDMPIIIEFSKLLTECFTSFNTNILYSRLKPVYRAANDTEKAAIQSAYTSIKDDLEPIVITSQNVLAEIEGQDSIKVLEITDVKNADKIQYIVKAIDDIIRMFFTYYAGQAIQGNGKLAQQTVDEVQGTTSTSFILPNDKLYQRRKWVKRINELFGTEIEVDFSDAWKTESLKYKKEADIDENGELEEMQEEETVTETDEETVKQTEKEEKEDDET